MDDTIKRLENVLKSIKEGKKSAKDLLPYLRHLSSRGFIDFSKEDHRKMLIKILEKMDEHKFYSTAFWNLTKRVAAHGGLEEVFHILEEGVPKIPDTKEAFELLKEVGLEHNLSNPETRRLFVSILYRMKRFWDVMERLAKYEEHRDKIIEMVKDVLPRLGDLPNILSLAAKFSKFEFLRPYISIRELLKRKEQIELSNLVESRKTFLRRKIEELRDLRLSPYSEKIRSTYTKQISNAVIKSSHRVDI